MNKSIVRPLLILLYLLLLSCDNGKLEKVGLSRVLAVSYEQSSDATAVSTEPLSVLVDASWLNRRLNNTDLIPVALSSSKASYLEGHISKARFLDWRTDIVDSEYPERYTLMPQADYQALLRRLGIQSHSTVVIYDEMSSRAAVRFFWVMKYYGHADVRVLDGGKEHWLSAGFELSEEVVEITPSEYQVKNINSTLLVDRAGVERRLGKSPSFLLVDGRPYQQYTGAVPGSVYHTQHQHDRIGHIYGAKSVPWADNFKADGTFRSVEDLLKIYEAHNIYPQNDVVTYCNEGLHAAVPWFVLTQILGYPDVGLYDRSMAEWANRVDTPMVTGEHCM